MLYLLFGEEDYLVKKQLARILDNNKNAACEKFESPAFDALIETMSIPSLFSPERIIIAENLDFSQDDEKFTACISSLPQGVSLVIKDPIGLDKRSKAYKVIESLGEVFEFKPIPEWEEGQVVDFVLRGFKDEGKTISRDDATLLVEGVGRDLGLLSSEITKISVYAGDKKQITKEDIEKLMVRSGWNSFKLAQSLLTRNKPESLFLLEQLLAEKENPVEILGLLSSQFRTLFKVKLLAQTGQQPPQITRRLKSSSFYVNRLFEAAKNFKTAELQKILELMYQTDLNLKSGYNNKTEIALMISEML